MRWFALILCLSLGGLLVYGAAGQWREALQLHGQGLVTQAVVVENVSERSTSTTNTGRNRGSYGYSIYPRFRFTAQDGSVHTVKGRVSWSACPGAR